jgi:[ribosomal protein S18]-alanine N-acetyltransferase
VNRAGRTEGAPPGGWTIEPLTDRRDIDAVLAIEEASFTSPWTKEMYIAEFENRGISFFYLAKAPPGDIVGFCSFWRVLDELHINNLAVLPQQRRTGVATALLSGVLGDGARQGAKRATLEVRHSNTPAQRLYERFGFTVAGVRRGYYTSPVEDALVLWKEGLP